MIWPHTINHYSLTSVVDGAGSPIRRNHYSLSQSNVVCFFQPGRSVLDSTQGKRQENKNAVCFIKFKNEFDPIAFRDVIVFNGHNYRVVANKDLCQLGRYYLLELEEDNADLEIEG